MTSHFPLRITREGNIKSQEKVIQNAKGKEEFRQEMNSQSNGCTTRNFKKSELYDHQITVH